MPWPFPKNKYRNGSPLHSITGNDIQTVYNVLNYITGKGCTIYREPTGIGWQIVVDGIGNLKGDNQVAYPFAPTALSTTSATLSTGYCEVHSDTGTSYIAPTSNTVALDSGVNFIYLKSNIVAGTATLERSATLAGVASTSTYYNKVLCKITVGSASASLTEQYVRSNVEFVGWRQ
jgi:hypothetical protein